MTSWERVSERSRVISGAGGEVGICCTAGFWAEGSSMLSSSRLWRKPRSEGMLGAICTVVMWRMRGEWWVSGVRGANEKSRRDVDVFAAEAL